MGELKKVIEEINSHILRGREILKECKEEEKVIRKLLEAGKKLENREMELEEYEKRLKELEKRIKSIGLADESLLEKIDEELKQIEKRL